MACTAFRTSAWTLPGRSCCACGRDSRNGSAKPAALKASELFELLADHTPASDEELLPSSALTPEWERILSSPFVLHEKYGTRCSTIVAIEPSGACFIAERSFDPAGTRTGETRYRLAPGDWPAPLPLPESK